MRGTFPHYPHRLQGGLLYPLILRNRTGLQYPSSPTGFSVNAFVAMSLKLQRSSCEGTVALRYATLAVPLAEAAASMTAVSGATQQTGPDRPYTTTLEQQPAAAPHSP